MSYRKRKPIYLSLLVMLIVGLMMPLPAIADDGSTPPEATPEPAEEPGEEPGDVGEESDIEMVSEDGVVSEEPTEEGEVGEEPIAEEGAGVEGPPLEDPFWCPDGSSPVPGSGGCTSGYSSFTDLLAFLDVNDADPGFQQDGTIYVTSGTYSNEAQIAIEGASYGTMAAYELTVQGGWDAGTQTVPAGSTTTVAVPVALDWVGSLHLFDIEIENVTTDTALTMTSSGDIEIADVDVSGIEGQATADLDSGGDITIVDSTFANVSGTGGSGLSADAGDDITVDGTMVSGSDGTGASLTASNDVTLQAVEASDSNIGTVVNAGGDVVASDSTFSNNNGGLQVTAGGDVSLDHVTASDNGFGGAYIVASGLLEVLSSRFERNVDGTGLEVQVDGDLTVTDTTLNQNGTDLPVGGYGAGGEFEAGGEMTLTDVTASGNHDDGLSLTTHSTTDLNTITAIGNGWNGVYLNAGCQDIFIMDGEFSNNGAGIHGGYGIEAYCPRLGINFEGAQTFSGNVSGDVLEDSICIPGSGCAGSCEKEVGEYVSIEPGILYPIPCDVEPADFKLGSGDGALFYGLCGYDVAFEVYSEDALPAPPEVDEWLDGVEFMGSLEIQLFLDADPVVTLTEDGYFTVSFYLLSGHAHRDYAILFWDPMGNDGEGIWLELPAYDLDGNGEPVVTELLDGMNVLEGTLLSPDLRRVGATVNFTGLFVLVRK